MKSEIIDKDNIPELLNQIKGIANKEMKVGFLGGRDSEIVKIAVINEFGALIKSAKAKRWLFAKMSKAGIKVIPRGKIDDPIIIPERAFLRKAFDDKKTLDNAVKSGVESYFRVGDLMAALTAIGESLKSSVIKSIDSNIQPPNHPFTAFAKGGKDKTLVNTGRLAQAVEFEIE